MSFEFALQPKQWDFAKSVESFPKTLYGGAKGGGKAQCVKDLVMTPFGPREMGEIGVGDQVLNPNGGTARVIQVHPQGKREVFEVTFQDECKIYCTLDHLWLARRSGMKLKADRRYIGSDEQIDFKVYDTKGLIRCLDEASLHVHVPLTEPVNFTQASRLKDPIHPYYLGVLLGDGCLCSSSISLTSADVEIVHKIRSLGYEVSCGKSKKNNESKNYGCLGIIDKLRTIKLRGTRSHTKYIPKFYKFSSVEDRIQLIQGMMDTDGYVDSRGHMSYTSVSKRLANDFREVICSLGGRATITEKDPFYRNDNGEKVQGRKAYTVYFRTEMDERLVFLERKRKLIKPFNGGISPLRKRIMSMGYSHMEEAKCITVDHPNGLYLTNDYTVTHNSHALRNIILLRRFKHPGSTGAIFRKSYPELEANHIRPMFKEFPQLRKYYHAQKRILSLPNGSSIEFCYCKTKGDIENYQGREYNDLGVEEAGQWTEDMYSTLIESCRSSIPGVPARVLLTANPGGVGHAWLKRLFISREYRENETPEDYNFIQALVTDNMALMEADPGYVKRLESQKNELLRRAHRWGDWDIQAGQFFTELNRNIHVIEPFDVPDHWDRFYGYDYGYNHPFVFLEFAINEDGILFLINEISAARKNIRQQSQKIRTVLNTEEEIHEVYAGHDIFVRAGQASAMAHKMQGKNDPSIQEAFEEFGIFMTRANIKRVLGADQIRNYLDYVEKDGDRVGPRCFLFNRCKITIDCLFRVVHNPTNVEDVLKIDSQDGDLWSGDDPYDAFRYGIMSRPLASKAIPEKTSNYDRYKAETDASMIDTSWRTI